MLLAVWSRAGAPRSQSLWASLDTAFSSAGHGRSENERGCIVVGRPARFEQRGDCAIGWLYSSPAVEDDADPDGPDVRLRKSSLSVSIGALPQYPLYYHRAADDSLFVVCSRLEPLVRALGSRRLHLPRLVSLATWQRDVDPGATVFADLRRLRPGETIVADAAGVRVTERLPRAGGRDLSGDPREIAMEVRARLRAAVSRAIGHHRRVAVLASGGLDSTGVVALALEHCRTEGSRALDLIALTGATPGDDRPYLSEVEKATGLAASRHSPSAAGPWFRTSLCVDAQPVVHGGACLNMYLFSAAVERSADVILTGASGDQVCGGAIDFAPLLRRGRPFRAVRQALRLRVPTQVSPVNRLGRWVAFPLVRPALPPSWVRAAWRRRVREPWMTPRFLELLDASIDATPVETPRTPDERLHQHCRSHTFADLASVWGQLASVTNAFAVDVYRDLDFVRFVSQIDPVLLCHDDAFRGLYRLAMKGFIPESIRTRQDKALGQPLLAEAALAADGARVLHELSDLRGLAALGLVEPARFAPSFEAWLTALQRGARTTRDRLDGVWQSMWQVLSVEAFVRTQHD